MSTTQVFIPHEEFVWVTGNVVSDNGKGELTVRIQDDLLPDETGVKPINLSKIGFPSLPPQNIGLLPQGVEDMTKLNYLHEPAILDNLKRYCNKSIIYVYISFQLFQDGLFEFLILFHLCIIFSTIIIYLIHI
jgi:myosin-5